MARFTINGDLGTALTGQPPVASASGQGDILLTTTLVADLAAAQAKGALDASAEIDTLDTDVTAYLAKITTPTFQIHFDNSTVTTMNQFKALLDAALQAAKSSGKLTG